MRWDIRQEKSGDEAAIAEITRLAFAGKDYADGTEEALPGALREAGALVLSLVAVSGKQIIGHVALSPAKIGAGRWLALGPVSVRPECQGQGVGSALVNHATAVAQAYGRDGVVLLGDPAFYGRLGFVCSPRLTYQGKSSPYLQVMAFGDMPAGDVEFHPAFGA